MRNGQKLFQNYRASHPRTAMEVKLLTLTFYRKR